VYKLTSKVKDAADPFQDGAILENGLINLQKNQALLFQSYRAMAASN
jgi:hypothetical protein